MNQRIDESDETDLRFKQQSGVWIIGMVVTQYYTSVSKMWDKSYFEEDSLFGDESSSSGSDSSVDQDEDSEDESDTLSQKEEEEENNTNETKQEDKSNEDYDDDDITYIDEFLSEQNV